MKVEKVQPTAPPDVQITLTHDEALDLLGLMGCLPGDDGFSEHLYNKLAKATGAIVGTLQIRPSTINGGLEVLTRKAYYED